MIPPAFPTIAQQRKHALHEALLMAAKEANIPTVGDLVQFSVRVRELLEAYETSEQETVAVLEKQLHELQFSVRVRELLEAYETSEQETVAVLEKQLHEFLLVFPRVPSLCTPDEFLLVFPRVPSLCTLGKPSAAP